MGSAEDVTQHGADDSELLLSGDVDSRATGDDWKPGTIRQKLLQWRRTATAACKGWIKQEAIVLIKLAVPIILTLFFQQSLLFVSLLYVGHITGKSLELDSAALAFSFVNVTGVSIGIGLSTAADTLCSQAYGYKNYKRVGVVTQRGILILGLVMLPIWALWLNTESFLLLVRQPPCVARLAGQYVKIYCLALPSIYLYIMLQKYLQNQSIVWTFVLMGFLTNVINAILHGILIFPAGLGLTGAAISMVIANTITPIMVIVYVWHRKLHKLTWDGWSWGSLREWWQFTKLAVPGLLMIGFEWWSAEVTAFISGSISETELAVNSIWFQLVAVIFMVPLGISIAVSIRVGNELGAGNIKRAKRTSFVAIGIILCIATFCTVLVQATKDHIGRLFTQDEVVIKRVSLLMNVACVFLYSDEIQITIAGILRGSGRQYIGAIVNFICYYVIGLPIGITLALKVNMGTLGLWIGLSIGNIIQCVTFVVVLLRTNWEEISRKAIERAQGSSEENNAIRKEDAVSESSGESEPQLVFSETSIDDATENTVTQDNSSQLDLPLDTDVSDTAKLIAIELTPLGNMASTTPKEATTEWSPTNIHTQYSRKLSTSRLKLLLWKGSFFVAGVAILIAAGVSSQYHPPVSYGNYSECTNVDTQFQSNTTDYYSTIAPTPTFASVVMETHGSSPTVSSCTPELEVHTLDSSSVLDDVGHPRTYGSVVQLQTSYRSIFPTPVVRR